MKLEDSLITRRRHLGGMLGGWLAALLAPLTWPIARFLLPPRPEPKEVTLIAEEFRDLAPGAVRGFAWGSRPALLRREADGRWSGFIAVCTHLDCNVSWLPEDRKFFCACHDGWYDEAGRNIAGPPPRPLRRLAVVEQGASLIVKPAEPKEEATG